MYRGNEASKVGGILELARAKDRVPLIAAVVEFWVTQPERTDEPDGAAHEVWRALVEADAIDDAIVAILPAMRERRLVRAHAFIDIVEHLSVPSLLEIASLALAAGWPTHPYLAAVCFTLVERQAEGPLWSWIQQNAERLASLTSDWALVSLLLSTTRVGSNADLAKWFAATFEQRTDVPMFVAAAYLVATHETSPYTHVAFVSRVVAATGIPDSTGAYLLANVMCESLRSGALEEFADAFRARGALLAPTHGLHHPLVRYLNGARHQHPITDVDLAYSFERLDASVGLTRMTQERARPHHWRFAVHLADYDPWIANCARILRIFEHMIRLEKGHPDAIELYRAMSKARPKSIPSLMPIWQRLVTARIPFFRRLRLEYF